MEETALCKMCRSRFKSLAACKPALAPEGKCRICAGMLSHIDKMIASALLSAKGTEWASFAVSSTFPRDVLVRESALAEWVAPGEFTSLKNSVNSQLIEKIAKSTKKKNAQRNADITFEFDFSKESAHARPNQIYIYGHYLKLSRKHCQSRWHCSECGGNGTRDAGGQAVACDACGGSGQNYPSVEEEIGRVLCPAFGASGSTLHASGREDVDVRCIGTGRPFVLELEKPAKRKADLPALEKALAANEFVRAIGLKAAKKGLIDSVCNSHFEKKYIAVVGADRPLTAKDAKKLESLSGATLSQQTPKRVLARRADLIRKRKVVSIKAAVKKDGKLELEILAEAGTYIKELISSDGGRTRPSVSELLNCIAVCEQLDVVEIRDGFLQTLSPDLFV